MHPAGDSLWHKTLMTIWSPCRYPFEMVGGQNTLYPNTDPKRLQRKRVPFGDLMYLIVGICTSNLQFSCFPEFFLWSQAVNEHSGWIHITFPLSPLYMLGYARPLRLQSCLPCQFTPEFFQGFTRKDKCRIVKQEMNCWWCRTNADAHCLQYSCELEI